MGSITAANSIVMLSITNLYPAPQRLVGYTADDMFATDAVEPAEVVKGVDGRMSAGWVPYLTRQTFNIMPDSPTSQMFEDWLSAQNAIQEIYFANAVITLPGIGRKYQMTNGVLTSIQAIASARRVLQGRPFQITWDTVAPVPY